MFQLIARHLLHTLNIIVVESFTTPHYYCPMSVQPLPALTVTFNLRTAMLLSLFLSNIFPRRYSYRRKWDEHIAAEESNPVSYTHLTLPTIA